MKILLLALIFIFPIMGNAGTLPLNYETQSKTLFLDSRISALTLNSKGAGDATLASSDYTQGFARPSSVTNVLRLNQSVIGTVNTTWNFDWIINTSLDSISRISFSYYNPDGFLYTVGAFDMQLRVATDNTYVTGYRYRPVSVVPNQSLPGWNTVIFDRATPASIDGAPTFSTVMTRARINVQMPLAQTGSIYISPVYIHTASRPKILFTFDDNLPSHYTEAFAYMNMAGKKITGALALNPKTDGVGLTLAQQLEMQTAGWSMHNHTLTHPDLTTLTDAQIRDEMAATNAWMEGRGLTTGRNTMVYPFSNANDATRATLSSLGFTNQVGWNSTSPNPRTGKHWNGIENPTAIQRIATDSGVLLSTLTADIDNAIKYGTTIIFVTHTIKVGASTNETETSIFQGLVDYALLKRDSNLVDILSLSDYLDGFTNARKRRY